MTISIIITLIAAIIGIFIAPFTFAKILIDIRASRRSMLREEYKIAKEFFTDLGHPIDSQQIIVERGYKAIAGDKELSIHEIKYILTLQTPDLAFFAYSSSQKLLKYNAEAKRVELRKKWLSDVQKRLFFKNLYHWGYVFIALFAILPGLFYIIKNPLIPTLITSHYSFFLPLLIPAIFCLIRSEEISSAHQFMALQDAQPLTDTVL